MTLHAFLLSPSLPLADWPATVHLLGAFALHLFFSLILVFVLYYQKSKRRTYAFSFLLIGAVVFLLSFLLSDIKIKLGLALGLFAIFGIIRYRTLQIPFEK
jgi:membrane protein CcdC involved in cytochrome C biogenesis